MAISSHRTEKLWKAGSMSRYRVIEVSLYSDSVFYFRQFRNMPRLRATGVSQRGETVLRVDPGDRHLGMSKLSFEPSDSTESRRVVAQSADQPAAESRSSQLEQRGPTWIEYYR